jgi:phage regulator Rha-like protein
MNELMNVKKSSTMSSLEIAKLTGKTHDNVLKDVRRILDEVEIDHVQFNAIFLDAYKREQPCFNLPRIECDLVVSGYSAPYRFAIIKRWQELEATQRPKTQLELAREQVVLLERLEAIEIERANLKVTLDMAHDWSSIKRMEMRDGKKYFYPPLRNYSKSNGYEVKKVFDQNYGEVNSYHKDVWEAIYGVVID